MGEPFERVIVDCVGPLPKTRSGNQYLLTIMCAATRYPEAIPLRRITTKVVVSALTRFFATFGLPKVVQTNQGSNFLSKVFAQVMKTLAIKHQVSSAYHPQSQGALERWHQALQSMLRKYCLDTSKDWDEGVPFVLFASRETIQESLKFSPAVFGHTVRGPLKLLKDHVMSHIQGPRPVLDYVSQFRERLHGACDLARQNLEVAQGKMKKRFDEAAVLRDLKPGVEVLVLLPVLGSSFSARFSGPYVIEKKLSETDYVVKTPDRRRQSRVCHVNMLKLFHAREPAAPVVPVLGVVVDDSEDDVSLLRRLPQPGARLDNSAVLRSLPTYLKHLDDAEKVDLTWLIQGFPGLFSDVPSRTTVLEHDVDVIGALPLKQRAYRVNQTKCQVMKQEVR